MGIVSASATPASARTTLLALWLGVSFQSLWDVKKQCFLQHAGLLENTEVADVRVPPPGRGGSDQLITGILLCLYLQDPLPTFSFSFITYSLGNLPKTARIIFPIWQSHLHCTFMTYNNNLSPREKVRVKCLFIDYLPWAKHHSQECSSLRAADCSCIGCELQKRTKVRTE